MALASGLGAQAQSWPSQPVRVVVAFPAGGLGDIVARTVQMQLQQALGQPVVIDNRGGAGGNVAAGEVARAKDGHTFLLTASTTQSVNPLIYPDMGVDFEQTFQPVAVMAKNLSFLFANPKLPATDFNSFVKYAQSTKLSYGSAGNGTNLHLAGELFTREARFDAVHVPYRGAAAGIQDVAAGQVAFMFGPASAMSLVSAGRLKVYGIASDARSPFYPELPTLKELGYPALQVDSYFVLYAPNTLPASVVARVNGEINRIVALPEVRAKFGELGALPLAVKPEEVSALVKVEARNFAEVIRTRNIRPD